MEKVLIVVGKECQDPSCFCATLSQWYMEEKHSHSIRIKALSRRLSSNARSKSRKWSHNKKP